MLLFIVYHYVGFSLENVDYQNGFFNFIYGDVYD